MKPVKALQKNKGLAERELAARSGVARGTLRAALEEKDQLSIKNLRKIALSLDRRLEVLWLPLKQSTSVADDSIAVVSLLAAQDQNWKVHFFNFVDAFRRTKDPMLILLPPVSSAPTQHRALLASIVCTLCQEQEIEIPAWAWQANFLPEPWFVSGMESLKASAILESPIWFRRNNIFVLANFLSRA